MGMANNKALIDGQFLALVTDRPADFTIVEFTEGGEAISTDEKKTNHK